MAEDSDLTDPIECISAITLVVRDMAASVAFYRSLGLGLQFGDEDASFVTFGAGSGFVNLQDAAAGERPGDPGWGRVVFWVHDVDEVHERALAAGLSPEMAPSDAPWGERYFHLRDPDGHELSFARPLDR